ncbi:hypothetical protein [Halomonas sp. MCCC 1A11062]|uniref:hypothetical protein n=1 Tax=Halomonas sp. MCCC 1A11062 TaxID=2733485 RepID=UPI001F268A52|nr:hypothetical protein [Halomonas sp. MCCC 1A11062]MCE8038929.1 hypothetical protein [Halomonas sp. MCCC 1A11062]
MAERVSYGGNPEHKANPGDFGLTPPVAPRCDKTLCDTAGIFERSVALALLQAGARSGLVSQQVKNGYPQNIWSVSQGGVPMEAQLENSEQGVYHGYPMPEGDPMRHVILGAWRERGHYV